MFQLLNPIALLAVAAVTIPVLIHLWNTRKGKTLKIGSIALLAESAKKPARSFRITNWPLLFLRCLLLILIALLLAKPVWQEKSSVNHGGWILLPDYELANAYRQHQGLIDSLMQKGYELHDLKWQEQPLTLRDTMRYKQTTFTHYNAWSYLKYLDAALPANYSVYFFSDQLAQHYAGERPAVNLDLHFITLQPQKRADTSVVSSYTGLDGKLVTEIRISTPAGNYYAQDQTDRQASSDTASVIHVGIYAGNNFADAGYLKAALEAIAAYTGRNIVISEGSSSGPLQVIFWLQETEPEKNALATLVPGGTIFRYQGPAISSVQLSSPANTGSFALDESNAGLFFKYASSPQAGTARWTFANGDPLMSIDASNNRKTVYFNSRFNPQWTDLVWKESFARMLIPIVLPSFKQNDTDLRQVSFSQAQVNPARGKVNGHVNEPGFMNSIDLSFAGWILIFLVFTAERILSHRQTKQKNA